MLKRILIAVCLVVLAISAPPARAQVPETPDMIVVLDGSNSVAEPVSEVGAAPVIMELLAVDAAGNLVTDAAIRWTLLDMTTGNMLLSARPGSGLRTELPDGSYLARAELNGQVGVLEFIYDAAGGAQSFNVVLSDSVTLEAQSPVAPGAAVPVIWAGPNASGDYLSIAPAGSGASAVESYARTFEGSPAAMTAPLVAGAYEIRYISSARNAILASVPLVVDVANVWLSAPEEVTADTGFVVGWQGLNLPGDAIILTPQDGATASALAEARTADGNPALLTAPASTGLYQLHYLDNSGTILASRDIAVIIPATLAAPPVVGMGSRFAVQWTGPGTQNDFITIVPLGAADDESGSYSYTHDGNPVEMTASDQPGAYELRYVTGRDRAVIAVLPINVIEVAATLEAPPVAVAGSEVKIIWAGPDNQNDSITIVPVGAPEGHFENFTYTTVGNPLALTMPEASGAFELRYVSGLDRRTLAVLPIMVEPTTVSLMAPPIAVAGSEVQIIWTGPDNPDDFITIVPFGAPQGQIDSFTYTSVGNPLGVRAPDSPGSYELRYVTGQDRMTRATAPLTLTVDEVSLAGPPNAVAGAEVTITWQGPDNLDDLINIVPVGAAESELGNYTFTSAGNPLQVQGPDFPGAYEVRYLTGQSRKIRASIPITLTAPQASLTPPPSAAASATVEISWEGPDNLDDYIVIVPLGAPEDARGNFALTRNGNPARIDTPESTGSYELRYISGQSRIVLATARLRVTGTAIDLAIADDLIAGAQASISFTGPMLSNDYLTIVPVGTAEGVYTQFYYAEQGSPAQLGLPDVPGSYELRYVSGQTAETLSRLIIEVSGVDIYLDAPDRASAGTRLSVLWDGPDNPQDFLTIVQVGAVAGSYIDYFYTSGNSPAALMVPDQPGAYEIRYVSGQTGATMGSRALIVE